MLEQRPDSAAVGPSATTPVVGDEGGARSAVPGVVGPSKTTVGDAVHTFLEPVVDVTHVPVGAVVLAELTNNKWVLLGDRVKSRLPAAPLVAVVEVVEVSTGSDIALGVIGDILKPLGEIV